LTKAIQLKWHPLETAYIILNLSCFITQPIVQIS